MVLNSFILDLGLIVLNIELILIIYGLCVSCLNAIVYIDYSTWKFTYSRLLVILSCIFLLLLLFILNFLRLGRTVELEKLGIGILSSYCNFNVNLLLGLDLKFIQVILLNIVFVLMLYLLLLVLKYYYRMIRVSFISLHYYRVHLLLNNVYPYKKLKFLINFIDDIDIRLSLFESWLDIKMYNYFSKSFVNEEAFIQSQSNSYFLYCFFRDPLRSIFKFMRDHLGLMLLLYYLALFFFYGTIVLHNIYYLLIFVSSLRLIGGIMYFLRYECFMDCIEHRSIIWSTYQYYTHGSPKERVFGQWHAMVGNLTDKKGFDIRSEAFEKYDENEISFNQLYKLVYKENSLDEEIENYISLK